MHAVTFAAVAVAVTIVIWLAVRRSSRTWRIPRHQAFGSEHHDPVRVLREADGVHQRSQPARPRIDPTTPLVFGDDAVSPAEHTLPSGRHGDDWALKRSAQRGRLSFAAWRVIAIVTLVLVALFVTGLLVSGGTNATHHSTVTTTTAG